MFLKEVFSQPCFPQVPWESVFQRWSSILPSGILCWESCHRLHTWINSSVCKGSSKICWSVSCSTWQLLDCSWLVLFPHLHWTLVPSPFRPPKSSSFSYGSNGNPRSASAVASLSPPHQENRIQQNSRHQTLWNSASVKAVIWCCLVTQVSVYLSGYWCLGRNDHVTYQQDDSRHRCWLSLRRMKGLCWDFTSSRHFAMTQADILAASQHTLSGSGCLRERMNKRE